jgi:hypothetical protein
MSFTFSPIVQSWFDDHHGRIERANDARAPGNGKFTCYWTSADGREHSTSSDDPHIAVEDAVKLEARIAADEWRKTHDAPNDA